MDINDFSDVRPYNDIEVSEVLQRLKQDPVLFQIMKFIYPNLGEEDIVEMLSSISSADQFQREVSAPAFKVIAQTTTSGLTFSNLDSIEKDKPYLFLSNHRDIILDSALLNVSLIEKDYPTTQIAIGDNLLQHGTIRDLVRLNKSFIVHRGLHPREMLLGSQRLSNYIRKTISEDGVSVWIAHKEGRSKDGDDRTASGLLKMLASSEKGSLSESLKDLNIIPTAVSYEYDPCDLFKAHELLMRLNTGEYNKKPGEDYRSALKGITGHKGSVNIALGNVLVDELKACEQFDNKNEQIRALAAEVDRQIHLNYKLWSTNYIAYDLLHGTRKYAQNYNPIQKITFGNYIRGRVIKLMVSNKKVLKREGYRKQAREVLLEMYANPVLNFEKASQIKEGSTVS